MIIEDAIIIYDNIKTALPSNSNGYIECIIIKSSHKLPANYILYTPNTIMTNHKLSQFLKQTTLQLWLWLNTKTKKENNN